MDKKKFSALLILCLANSVIYTLPFIQNTYYEAMRTAYGFSHIQMGNLVGVFGTCNLIAYFFGGIAADCFDTKHLFLFSLVLTGCAGLYSATFPSYTAMMALGVVWSISTILTFWSALIKAIKQLADTNHQGWVFGIKETIVCLMTFAISMLGLFIFNQSKDNIALLIIFYSALHLAVAGLVLLFMPSGKPLEKPDVKTLLGGIKQVIKIPGVWMIGAVIFLGTNIGIILGRFTPFMTMVCGLNASGAAFVTIAATNGFANIGSYAGGTMCDKLGSPAKFLAFTMGFCAVCAALFVLMPWGKETVILCIGMSIILRILNGGLRSAYFATMSQVDIPQHLFGTASGIISIIGYLPDAFAYSVWGAVLEQFAPLPAFKIIFTCLVVFCLVGMLLCVALHKYAKKLHHKQAQL